MRKALLLCSLVLMLSSGIAHIAKGQDAGIVPPGDNTIYKVVVNPEEQYSIWPADRENPLGWDDAGKKGTKEECLAWIKELWEGMRPPELQENLKLKSTSTSDEAQKTEQKQINEVRDKVAEGKQTHQRKSKDAADKLAKITKEIYELLEKIKLTQPEQNAPGFKAETTSAGELSTTTFTTPQGRIIVHLPDDMREGDTVSGTVLAEPNGQTEEERARNRNDLNAYQLLIANQKITEPWGTFTWLVADPALPPAKRKKKKKGLRPKLKKSLKKQANLKRSWKKLLRKLRVVATIPVFFAESEEDPSQTPTPNVFRLPSIGQQGRPIEIPGNFDGDASNTTLNLKPTGDFEKGTENIAGGFGPIRPLAESPRQCIFEIPSNVTGSVEVTLKEGNVETKGTYRNLGVHLSAPKTNLMRGEKTTVTVEVSGLEGIKEDVPLQLDTRGVVQMDGGNFQSLLIRPQDVKADGRYTTTRAITGQQAGGFTVTATVIDMARRPVIIPLVENGRVNGFRVKKDGNAFLLNIENVEDPLKGELVDGEHKVEYRCPQLSQLPYVKNLFLNKGVAKTEAECLVIVTPRIIIMEEQD